jgi:signal transduction histidine kinase
LNIVFSLNNQLFRSVSIRKVIGKPLKLSTRLTISLSLLIIFILGGYGYFHIQSRRDVLFRKMQTEVLSAGRTLKVALEKISIPREVEYVQGLIDAVEAYEKTLGVMVYHKEKDIVFRSASVKHETEPYLNLIRRSIEEDSSLEGFSTYKSASVFFFSFPLKDAAGKNVGGASILQHTSFMEQEIKDAKWMIFLIVLILMGGTVGVVFFITRRSIDRPMSALLDGIRNMAQGNLGTQITLRRSDELGELAKAFNHMARSLKENQERLLHEGEIRLDLERNLRQSERMATIGQLASVVAHEVGTPLNIIAGRARITQNNLGETLAAQNNLGIILDQTRKITKIVQQLLDFARKKNPQQKRMDVNHLLVITLDLLDYQIQRKGVSVTRHLEDGLPFLKGDPDLIQQVFVNLTLNSLQSMPNGGTLHISTSSKQILREGPEYSKREYVEVCVEDTGTGMDEGTMKNLFTPFFTTKERGTGLGLIVTHGIIREHGGWIDVKSKVGQGSVFTFYLPAFREEVNVGRE